MNHLKHEKQKIDDAMTELLFRQRKLQKKLDSLALSLTALTREGDAVDEKMDGLTDSLQAWEQAGSKGVSIVHLLTKKGALSLALPPEESHSLMEMTKGGEVRCGSLNDLVTILTHPEHCKPTFRVAFLLTFQSFTNPMVLLARLLQKFSMTDEEILKMIKSHAFVHGHAKSALSITIGTIGPRDSEKYSKYFSEKKSYDKAVTLSSLFPAADPPVSPSLAREHTRSPHHSATLSMTSSPPPPLAPSPLSPLSPLSATSPMTSSSSVSSSHRDIGARDAKSPDSSSPFSMDTYSSASPYPSNQPIGKESCELLSSQRNVTTSLSITPSPRTDTEHRSIPYTDHTDKATRGLIKGSSARFMRPQGTRLHDDSAAAHPNPLSSSQVIKRGYDSSHSSRSPLPSPPVSRSPLPSPTVSRISNKAGGQNAQSMSMKECGSAQVSHDGDKKTAFLGKGSASLPHSSSVSQSAKTESADQSAGVDSGFALPSAQEEKTGEWGGVSEGVFV